MEVRQAYAAESFEWDQLQRLAIGTGQVGGPKHASARAPCPGSAAELTQARTGLAGRQCEAAARPRRGVLPAPGRRGRTEGRRLTSVLLARVVR